MFLKPYDDAFLNILKVGDAINYSRFTKLIYLSFFENKNDIETINCIVDKNPFYTFHINKVLKVFPDAKMLVMVRDYRGYILSNRQSQNTVIVKKSVAYYAVAWNYYIKNILRIDRKNSGQVKLMRYEDLVEQREREVKSIVEFFGLKFSNDLLNFQEALKGKIKGKNLIGRRYEHLLKRLEALSAPINSSRASEWVVKLTMAEKEHADCISSGYGAAIGYSGVAKISNLKKLFYQLKTIPAYIRVGIFFRLNSPKLFYYLNVKNKLEKEKNS